MSVKRSRVERSSPDLNAEQPRSKILTFASSTTSSNEPDQMKVGAFLERCYYCKKRLAPDSEIYMYSNFCAFCSSECRDVQMALDQAAKKKPESTNNK